MARQDQELAIEIEGQRRVAENVPPPQEWATTLLSGTDIADVQYFNIEKRRALIAEYGKRELETIP